MTKGASSSGAQGHAKKAVSAPPYMKRTKEPTAKLQDIMDKDDSQEKGGKRQLKRRSTDETIRKKVRDNFVGFTETELTMNLRQGLNVFDRIKADMKKSETTPQFRMGKLYYEELRNLYRDPEGPLAALVPKDMTESVDKDLERSLCALLQTRRSTAELHQWAQHTTNINQLSLVALLRQVLKMPAIKSLENANIGISILKLFAKLKIHESFPSEWAAVKAHFDMCLVRTLAAFKSEEQTSSVWWEVHKDFAKLLLPERSMEAALSCETDWASVQAEVQEVYESSEVGRRLMARAIKQLETESVGARVAKAVQDLREVENITMAELEKNKKHFLAAMDMCHVDVNQPFMPRKEVPIEYKGGAGQHHRDVAAGLLQRRHRGIRPQRRLPLGLAPQPLVRGRLGRLHGPVQDEERGRRAVEGGEGVEASMLGRSG